MSWSFLTQLLEEIHNHSTFIGKIWLTVLIVFRIVLTVVGGESIYNDEQSHFKCNTLQPGCVNSCYNSFAPISQIRFLVFQIILVTTPPLFYLGFAIHKITKIEKLNKYDKKAEDHHDGNSMKCPETEPDSDRGKLSHSNIKHDGRKRIKADGLLRFYVFQLLLRTVFEGGSLAGQYFLYGFQVIEKFECTGEHCPYTVDCFISRPTEKTIFLLTMYAVNCLCLVLNICEIFYLGFGTICDAFTNRRKQVDETLSAPPGYNIAVKQISSTKHKNANIAQDEQYRSSEDNISTELHLPQERLILSLQVHSSHNNPPSDKENRSKKGSSNGAKSAWI